MATGFGSAVRISRDLLLCRGFVAENLDRLVFGRTLLDPRYRIPLRGGRLLLNDALSVSTFLVHFFFSLQHAMVLAFFSAPVLAGHLVRGFLVTKSGHGRPST